MPAERTRLDRLAVPLLLLAGLLIHLPWLCAPFGFYEMNAGYFFGPFAQSWERFGFFELRGVPLGASLLTIPETPAQGFPYFNHPPGFAWSCAVFGTAEWQLRLPCVLAAIACGPLLFALSRARLAAGPALLAGLLVMAVPAVTLAAVVSYESVVMALGLCLWLLHERGARGGCLVVCVVGTWIDWAFGFYVLALLPLCLPGSWRELARRLWRPWLAYAASLLLVVVWMLWAKQAPFVPPAQPGQETLADTLQRAVFGGPPLGVFFAGLGDRLRDGFTLPLLLASLLGLLPALRSAPRLLLTALLPPVLNIGIFRNHAADHLMFASYLAPGVALGAAHLLAALSHVRTLRVPAVAAGAALVLGVVWQTVEWKRGACQPLFARLGAALSEVGDAPSPDADRRAVLVATNAAQNYPYYVTSPRVLLAPVLAHTELAKQRPGVARLRYVYLQSELQLAGQPPIAAPDEPLRTWLAQFPSHPLPQLVGTWPMGHGNSLVVHAAAVYDL